MAFLGNLSNFVTMKEQTLNIFQPDLSKKQEIPIAGDGISAGFPSPSSDFIEMSLDLNKELIKNPYSTFFARVSGDSMEGDNINDGDLLVIDKSVDPADNCIAVCYIDGDFTLKRFKKEGDYGWLVPSNSKYKPIKVDKYNDFEIWGVVRFVIKKM